MAPIRLSIAFQSDKTPAEYEALADLVDRYAFQVVSVYNDLLYQPALGPLLLMARRLRRAQVGPAALNPYTVHPVEIAGQAALLDLVSAGRAYLGLARGAWLDAIGVRVTRPLRTLREAVLLVRHLLEHRAEAFEGEVFRHPAGAPLRYATLRPDLPIMIGTWGVRTARMAGEVADEIKVGGSTNPAMVGVLRPALAEGATRAGRAADAVGICLGAVTVVDEDRAVARALARRQVALYLTVVARLDPTVRDEDPAWLARVDAATARNDLATIAADIPDAVLDRFAFAGTPADLVRRVERLAEAGATRVEFGTPHGVVPAEGVRLLGERVLPHFA
jgi:5,10-methylenetetrahydromethanopterin reductase